MSISESMRELLEVITIDLSKLKEVDSHDDNAAKKAHERLDYLEDLVGEKYSQSYRDGFVQGYIEASWASEK